MKNLLARFAKDESGATAIEYGLIAGLISIGIVTAVTTAGRFDFFDLHDRVDEAHRRSGQRQVIT